MCRFNLVWLVFSLLAFGGSCLAENNTVERARPCLWQLSLHKTRLLASSTVSQPAGLDGSNHKSLLPVSTFDIAAFCVAGIVLFIAAGAGVGGGPVLVPVYLSLGAFSTAAAVALSNSTILAGSVANTLCNMRKRHPFRDRPLVDWDLILLMQPPTLIGAVAGSYINKLLPSWISHLLLAIMLTLLTVRVLQRAVMVRRREAATHKGPKLGRPSLAAAASADPGLAANLQPNNTLTDGGALTRKETVSNAGSLTGSEQDQTLVCQQQQKCMQPKVAVGPTPAQVMHGQTASDPCSCCAQSCRGGDAVVQLIAVSTVHSGCSSQVHCCQVQGEGLADEMQETPPSEAECRLAYGPPGHTRRNSWEFTWDDGWELQPEKSAAAAAIAAAPADEAPASITMYAAHAGQQQQHIQQPEQDPLQDHHQEPAAVSLDRPQATSGEIEMQLLQPPVRSYNIRRDSPYNISLGSPNRLQTQVTARRAVNVAVAEPNKAQDSTSSDSSNNIAADAGDDSSSKTRASDAAKAATAGYWPSRQQPPELAILSDRLQAVLRAERAQLPPVALALMAAMFLAVLLTSMFSKKAGCGTAGFWLIQWAVAPVLLGVWWFSRRRVLARTALKRALLYDFHGDIHWTSRNSIVFPAICSIAGLVAGMFGLGGAVVKTPLMLELGVHPQVTAATTQTMLLLTSAASTIVYAQLGDVPWDYAAVILPLAFVATLAGQLATDWVVKRLGRSSLVVAVLAGFFVVACGLTYYITAVSLKEVAADAVGTMIPGKICNA
eukprot:GHRR01002153.1.p1 GENE.GHRR01002153.1~~GHRR01002153.1.p1  ORF type:complete len:776 (+),score=239.30 GHRR01002153.1:136-2463(+)